MTTIEGLGALGPTETDPGLERQAPADNDYLVSLRTNYIKNLVPQIVVPNNAWMGRTPDYTNIPISSTDPYNSYGRTINQSHAFRDRQIFFGN